MPVHVPAHGMHRRYFTELIQNGGRADITRVKNGVRAVQHLERAIGKMSVRIGKRESNDFFFC